MPSIDGYLSPALQNRLLVILSSATATLSPQYNVELVNRVLEALLECCARSRTFWDDFRHKDVVISIVQELLLADERPFVRKAVYKLISSKCVYSHGAPGVPSIDFAEFFWPVVFGLFPRAMNEPAKCEEVFSLAFVLMKKLVEVESPVIDLRACLAHCGRLLLGHTTVEDISRPELVDATSHGLIAMLHYGLTAMSSKETLPFPEGFGEDLLRKHLFPLEDSDCAIVPQVLLHSNSRSMLCDVLFIIAKSTPERFRSLLQDMCELVPYESERDSDPYRYELPYLYDRHKAVRSPCGYPGLRNLSNTCYLNSLFTQLFMNTGFRRFILEMPVADPETHQLLNETQALFAQLQHSARRYVDPGLCAASIMTYDETPIDIHNQMDVDEFYNLLFDRWEAQLPDDKAKRTLKSIYGGQLVQQVKSKECEHISERIEPFSAIQCDIKGKANLEESLQAYVDGEIMEGENKYKCETCDRHVDAVKRACLKELPDNLIFHLKRFDFNLRTLQRSKINDFFPFPDKIDMQPYTVEGLSDPSGRAEPDTFELVGVLVHSGNAESGHYYSFIRERPSLAGAPSWMEFNDDSVLAWDPAHMENACFGGPDYRQPFENTAFDKVYSAYMLFYQRSSSVKREQRLLELSGKPSPLKFSLPTDLEAPVKADNWAVVNRYCLNDAAHGTLVKRVLGTACGLVCSQDHETEDIAMDAALGYLDQVASRAKDTPDYEGVFNTVLTVCKKCPRCCLAMFRYLTGHKEALRNLLQRNAEPVIRQSTSAMLIMAFSCLRQALPVEYGILDARVSLGNCLTAALKAFSALWETFHITLRAWAEYFGTMAEFAQLGRLESGCLLQADFLEKLLMIIVADNTMDLPPQYARLLHTLSRRVARGPPSYEYIIALIDTLLSYMDDSVSDSSNIVETADARWDPAMHGHSIPFTGREINLIHKTLPGTMANTLVDRLIRINQNAVATDSIIVRLTELHPLMDSAVLATLRSSISGQAVTYSVAPYLRVAAAFVRNSSTATSVQRLINHICLQCRQMQNTEADCFLEFFKEVHDGSRVTEGSSDVVRMQSLRDLPKWVPGLLACADETLSCNTEIFVKDVLFPEALSWPPSAAEANQRQALEKAGRELAMACVEYAQETYIRRRQQAPRHAVETLERTMKCCGVFFPPEAESNGQSRREYEESWPGTSGVLEEVSLCSCSLPSRSFSFCFVWSANDVAAVLDQVRQLVVDEIEDEGSGMWSDSSSSTLDDMN